MNTYFIGHQLVARYPDRGPPGRYPYSVTGHAIRRAGSTLTHDQSPGQVHKVYADSYEKQPASNMDPHVLSDVIPWFLSFCLIDKASDPQHDTKRLVYPGKTDRLPALVTRGDIILFGNSVSKHVIFVDTVLCVDKILPIPQSNGRLNIRGFYDQYRTTLNLPESWEAFQKTTTYTHNLKDAEPGGNHHFTRSLNPYSIIIGTRPDPALPKSFTTKTLLDRLLDGKGINFIPLRAIHESENAKIGERDGLFTADLTLPRLDFRNDLDSVTCLNQLESNPSRAILSAIIESADTLVLDPIKPVTPPPQSAKTRH